ncbi:MAG: 2-hydroxycarboxylate transporter family protein [Clostridiales Family XIII bacterium]|jgi:CCS family citrate carrier protein|nr:2-hydroxycarboxylate transporter family protein [Clostridiales Family XIII bacterium]
MSNTSAAVLERIPEQEEKVFKIYGMPWHCFLLFSAVVLAATYIGVLPAGMIGAFPLMIVIGAVFGLLGDKTPFINTFLGGGPILVIFGSAALVTFGILPETYIENMTNFMKTEGFLDFYIAALITGSILGMNRKMLIRAALRYLPVILGGVVLSLTLAAILGAVTGYGAKQAIFFIAIPIMGGGMGAGAVPLSQIFGDGLNTDPAAMLNIMIPAVALGNALAIVSGGLLNRIGKGRPFLSGEGRLMRVKDEREAADMETDAATQAAYEKIDLGQMAVGLLIATSFFAFGTIINKFVPDVHSYAWMIISVAVIKALGIMPQKFEVCCYQWFQFVMRNLTGVLLVGIGIAYTNLSEIASAFSVQYLLLVAATVFGSIVGSGFVGRLVGLYPIEASITAGLCMANMGGTGDVAVLSAAKRMELMPFAQISSRIGGAFMLILATVALQLFR